MAQPRVRKPTSLPASHLGNSLGLLADFPLFLGLDELLDGSSLGALPRPASAPDFHDFTAGITPQSPFDFGFGSATQSNNDEWGLGQGLQNRRAVWQPDVPELPLHALTRAQLLPLEAFAARVGNATFHGTPAGASTGCHESARRSLAFPAGHNRPAASPTGLLDPNGVPMLQAWIDAVPGFAAVPATAPATPRMDSSRPSSSGEVESRSLSTPTLSESGLSLPDQPVKNQVENSESLTLAPQWPDARRESSVCTETATIVSSSSKSSITVSPAKRSADSVFIAYDPNDRSAGKHANKRRALDDEPRERTVMKAGSGQVQGERLVYGSTGKGRGALAPEKRERTATVRRAGACPRCKEKKRSCDLCFKGLYESCTECAKPIRLLDGIRLPCFRTTLEEALLFRAGPAVNEPLFSRRRQLLELADMSKQDVLVKTIKLTQNCGFELTVYVSEFTPEPTDKVDYMWIDPEGREHTMEMPRYCLTNISKIQKHMVHYVSVARRSYLQRLENEDPLVWMTVSRALQYADDRPGSLVEMALNLWATARMIEVEWEMCGEDTLGVSRVTDAANPWLGMIPIPPNMDTQLDQIIIQGVLRPLKARLMAQLEHRIREGRREAFFEIYLTTFILLSHISMLAKHSIRHARRHSMRTRFSNVGFLEDSFHAANILLSRFHFVCNGLVPVNLNWRSESVTSGVPLTTDQVELMERTQEIIQTRESEIRSLIGRHKYEDPLFWSHQMLYKWASGPTRVMEIPD